MAKASNKPAKSGAKLKEEVLAHMTSPHLSEMVDEFIDWAGGPPGIAKLLYEEFRAAKAGSIVRQRVLDMVLKSWDRIDDKRADSQDRGQLSDADLERHLEELMQKAMNANS